MQGRLGLQAPPACSSAQRGLESEEFGASVTDDFCHDNWAVPEQFLQFGNIILPGEAVLPYDFFSHHKMLFGGKVTD